jgi:tetratricopeptide (TPR) repeat protein
MTRRGALALSLALVALAAAVPARADDVAEARGRFRKGVELYGKKRWRDAMAEFEAAYRLKPHGSIHFNIGQCRERLEDWAGAIRSYTDYLRDLPAAPDRADVKAALARIDERLAASGLQALLVYTDPPGARVSVDGRERGTTPLHEVVTAGSHALVVAREGSERVDQAVVVAPGTTRVVELVLRPAAPRPDLAARPGAVPGVPPAAATAPAPRPAKRGPPTVWERHWPAFTAAAVAAVATGIGVAYGRAARADERAIDGLATPDGGEAARLGASARSKARTANAWYAVAAGAAVAGGALFVLEARF